MDEYIKFMKNNPMPGLNDILSYYEAQNGLNNLKEKMGEYFAQRKAIERPIC